MAIVFQFRMLSDENDNFLRDYEVLSDMTLADFHNFILQTLEYEECMASFFTADDRWEKLREFTLMDMGEEGEDAPQMMDSVTLEQILHKLRDRLIYLFDVFGDRAYFLELVSVVASTEGAQYPREIYALEDVPNQYAATRSVETGEGTIFDEVMGDFNDFEGSEGYEDEY